MKRVMGNLRIAPMVTATALMLAACSGTDPVDLPRPDGTGSGSSGGTTTHGDAAGAPSDGASASSDGSSGDDIVTIPDDSAAFDATLDGDLLDASPGADAMDADGGDATTGPIDAGGNDSFACGPTLRCDPSSQYCNVAPALTPVDPGPVTNIVFPLDGGGGTTSRYSCVALPACDAASECLCIQGIGTGPILEVSANIVPSSPSCSCTDSKGEITRTCKSGGVMPLAN
jgi:hypothetical protein